MLDFKKWLMNEIVDTGEAQKEKIPVTAMPTVNKDEDPPTSGKKSPTDQYDQDDRESRSGQTNKMFRRLRRKQVLRLPPVL